MIKRKTITFYYNFLMFLEDVFGGIETKINNHRKVIDKKYWEKYICPMSEEQKN